MTRHDGTEVWTRHGAAQQSSGTDRANGSFVVCGCRTWRGGSPPALGVSSFRRVVVMQETTKASRRNWVWPAIDTPEAARSATRQAFWAAVYCASVTSLLALLSVLDIQLFPKWHFDLGALLDAGIFGLIAWGLAKHSKLAALAGLLFYLFETVDRWIAIGPINLVLTGIMILAFVSGVRGTFAYQAARQPPPTSTPKDERYNPSLIHQPLYQPIVQCWRCKSPIEVTPAIRGKKVRCPSCRTKQQMPI
jgi:hypothetical protein